MLVFIRHVYHDEFRAPDEALGCRRARFAGRFSARDDFGPEAAGRGQEEARETSWNEPEVEIPRTPRTTGPEVGLVKKIVV